MIWSIIEWNSLYNNNFIARFWLPSRKFQRLKLNIVTVFHFYPGHAHESNSYHALLNHFFMFAFSNIQMIFFQNDGNTRISDDLLNKTESILSYDESICVLDTKSRDDCKEIKAKHLGIKTSIASLSTMNYDVKESLLQSRCPIIFQSQLTWIYCLHFFDNISIFMIFLYYAISLILK